MDRDTYWRPFEDLSQESVASFHAFGFAAANGAGLGWNPLVARHIDLLRSRIEVYPHWPNGFFLFLEGVFRVFGRTETVGRWVAILTTLAGFTLVLVALQPQGWLVYGSLPLLLLSSAGRDSVPFVFLEPPLYLSIGVLAWLANRGSAGWFRLALAAAPCLNQLILPYAALLVLVRAVGARERREALLDLAALAGGAAAVLSALAFGGGLAEIVRVFKLRSSHSLAETLGALHWDLRLALHLGPLSSLPVAAAWVLLAVLRQWRTALLLPSFLVFALVFRQYVTLHHFTRLPWIYFSMLTLAAALELAVERLPWPQWLRLGLATGLAAAASTGSMVYTPDARVQATRRSLQRLAAAPQLRGCNAFEFTWDDHRFFSPADRMGQFYFGTRVIERLRRNEPVRRCRVELR
jgi:hypothetical protein